MLCQPAFSLRTATIPALAASSCRLPGRLSFSVSPGSIPNSETTSDTANTFLTPPFDRRMSPLHVVQRHRLLLLPPYHSRYQAHVTGAIITSKYRTKDHTPSVLELPLPFLLSNSLEGTQGITAAQVRNIAICAVQFSPFLPHHCCPHSPEPPDLPIESPPVGVSEVRLCSPSVHSIFPSRESKIH